MALERRHIERSGQPSTLMVISLDSGTVPTTDGRRLERILLEKLRTGDPIARLEAGSYVIMLTGADEENARLVFGRGSWRRDTMLCMRNMTTNSIPPFGIWDQSVCSLI